MVESKQPAILHFLLRIVSALHRLLFRAELGPEARAFFINLFYVVSGTGLAAIITFGFTIIGGRALGPAEFGKYSLIQSTAFILYIPMLAGFGSAMVKLTSETEDVNRQKNTISTAYGLTTLTLVGSLIVYYSFHSWLTDALSLNPELLNITILISVVYVIYTLAISTQRGLKMMKDYAVWQLIYAVVLIGSFLIFLQVNSSSFQAMAIPLLLGYGVTGSAIIYLLGKRHSWGLAFDRDIARILNKYAFLGLIVLASSSIYVNIGKIFVAHFMKYSDVGIYSAYYGSSMNLGSIIFIAFNTVFFPTISGYKDKKMIIEKLDRLVPYLVVLGTIGIFIFEYVVIRLFGNDYPRDYLLMLSFALTTVLSIWYSTYAWVFNAEGLNGSKFTSISIVIVATLVVVLSLVFIRPLGLEGAVWAMAIAFICGISFLEIVRKHVFIEQDIQP